jgi:hypothetical protein
MRLRFLSMAAKTRRVGPPRQSALPRGETHKKVMKIEKQREIVIEFERVQLVRKTARTNLNYCPACQKETDFVSLCQAASLFSIEAAALFDFIKIHNSHFQPDPGGMIFVCLFSLLARMKSKPDISGIKLLDE